MPNLAGCLVSWLVDWLAGMLVDWFIGRLVRNETNESLHLTFFNIERLDVFVWWLLSVCGCKLMLVPDLVSLNESSGRLITGCRVRYWIRLELNCIKGRLLGFGRGIRSTECHSNYCHYQLNAQILQILYTSAQLSDNFSVMKSKMYANSRLHRPWSP